MFAEDDLVPLSALQHLLFCERQCALIHVEQLWAENRLTVEGRHLHKKVDSAPAGTRGGIRIARGVPLRSFRLGLIGKADTVEFHPSSNAGEPATPFPVEYKRGRPKKNRCDEVQLCAQALCLEEMLATRVEAGALFYGKTRRRKDIAFDSDLRDTTERAAARVHELIRNRITPRARREPKCMKCSLLNLCLPGALAPSASDYVQQMLTADAAPPADTSSNAPPSAPPRNVPPPARQGRRKKNP